MDHFVFGHGVFIERVLSHRPDCAKHALLNAVKGEKQQTSLNQVILECRNIMADLADQMDIPLNADLIANQDLVLIDVDEFVQALTNMIRNSFKQSNKKELNKRLMSKLLKDFIRLRSVEEGDHVVVYVEDTGVGISKENQAKLFETQFSKTGGRRNWIRVKVSVVALYENLVGILSSTTPVQKRHCF